MARLHVDIAHVYINPHHVQRGVPQHPLQGEHIAAVAQVGDGEGMAEGVRLTADALKPLGDPVILDPLLQAIERHRLTIAGEEQAGALRAVGLGAMSLQVGTTFLGGRVIFTLLKRL